MASDLSHRWRERLARKSGSVSTQLAWTAGARPLLALGWSEEGALRLLETWRRPRSLQSLARALARSSDDAAAGESDFFGRVEALADASEFASASWLAALEETLAHADGAGRSLSLETMLGYIACSAEWLASSGGAQGLPDAVASMLEEHGIEG